MADAPTFTDRDIERIRQSLPDGVDPQRLKLLPKILRDWAATDLSLHLSMPTAKERGDRIKRLEALAASSKSLVQALDAVDQDDDPVWIMGEMIAADGRRLSATERIRAENHYQEMRDFLGRLPSASIAAAKNWKKGRGQPRNDAASLVLMDLVAIYEWLTRRRASRQVSRVDGADTGPFWEFAGAIWPLVFGNADYGLSSAIRNWDSARKKRLKGTRSPLLANIAMRHGLGDIGELAAQYPPCDQKDE